MDCIAIKDLFLCERIIQQLNKFPLAGKRIKCCSCKQKFFYTINCRDASSKNIIKKSKNILNNTSYSTFSTLKKKVKSIKSWNCWRTFSDVKFSWNVQVWFASKRFNIFCRRNRRKWKFIRGFIFCWRQSNDLS